MSDPTLKISEAMRVLNGMQGKSFKIEDYRVVAMSAEFVDFDREKLEQLQTRQATQEDKSTVAIRTDFQAWVAASSGSPPAVRSEASEMISLHFGIGITYRFGDDVDAQSRQVFSKTNGVMHAWPHFRTFVVSTLAQMGVHGNVVPLLSLPEAMKMAGFTQER